MKNKINIIILCFALTLLNGCTILFTEAIKQSAKSKQEENYGEYFVPNLNNMDSNFINIETILASTIDTTNLDLLYDTNLINDTLAQQEIAEQVRYNSDEKIFDTTETISSVLGIVNVNTKIITERTNKTTANSNSKNNYILNISNLDASYYPDSIIVNVVVQNESGEFVSGLATPYLTEGRKNSDF
jgi:hypothetical protein